MSDTIELDGENLTVETLVSLRDLEKPKKIALTETAKKNVFKSEKTIKEIVKKGDPMYGINTGFGDLKKRSVKPDQLSKLQFNLIRSHSVGVGKLLTPEQTRMLLALRINILAKGHSGITLKTLNQCIDAFNACCLSCVPEQGTVGASGDLAPLAHLALGLMGEGEMWSPETGRSRAIDVLKKHNLEPISLEAKEGLALINGTQLIASIGAEALCRAKAIAKQADVVAALCLEVYNGTKTAYNESIHKLRKHAGQIESAARLRALLSGKSTVNDPKNYKGIQDPYVFRCIPQVHGIVLDTIRFVESVLETEINSATDNPLVIPGEEIEIISCGNFHGEYPAKALDYLAIGIHELANISERRIDRLLNPDIDDEWKGENKLPPFLIAGPEENQGLQSGFMIAQYTAASLVSENKALCHPASVDSITTCAASEDHVSMGGWSARKAVRVVEHVETVLAIELLAACQALDIRRNRASSPHLVYTTEPLQKVYALVREHVKFLDDDREMASDINKVTALLRESKVWEIVKPYVEAYMKK